ncbi:hypothetical protein [Edaphobacillus lindanitolerans]|uniref:Uncharacterized protein n=1 Tax=Edaphobacillus lindanitolerans TaxID=550447 RepID=A0A1U7PSR4_9BACI|nr:hypothetical protein [Edaphobacillus lindanitolerans]SIT90646.1 hypothetical protein SAMN05428946_2492 [Edaphobacillus lindanitolerans]
MIVEHFYYDETKQLNSAEKKVRELDHLRTSIGEDAYRTGVANIWAQYYSEQTDSYGRKFNRREVAFRVNTKLKNSGLETYSYGWFRGNY